MNTSVRDLFRGAMVALCLVGTAALFAQEAPPAEKSAASAPAPVPAKETAAPATAPEATPPPAAAQPDLPRPDAPAPAQPPSAAPAATATPAPAAPPAAVEKSDARPADETPATKPAKKTRVRRGISIDPGPSRHGERVQLFNDIHVAAGETVAGDVVAVMGDLLVDGEAQTSAVAVMGDNTINGTVQRDAIAVMGDVTINGTVHGRAVAVMGDIVLGPKARVDGDLVSVGGSVSRAAGAVVGGKVVEKSIEGNVHVGLPFSSLLSHGFKLGGPFLLGARLLWLWIFTAACLAFFALLALLFPRAIRKCGDALLQRPGLTILAFILTILILPILFLLLFITIIGIPVALFLLPLGVLLLTLFGKAAIYALVGRAVSRDRLHPALAVLAGGLIFALLYLVPLVGLALSMLASALGLGCVIVTIFTPKKKETSPVVAAPAVAAQPAPAVAPVMPAVVAGLTAGIIAADTSTVPPVASPTHGSPSPTAVLGSLPIQTAAPVPPPPAPPTTLPRAGFWLRMGALAIDLVLVGLLFALFENLLPDSWSLGFGGFLLLAAAYGATLWKLRATTIGGIVCNLKIVRLDDRPLDWTVAIVRALGCFLSVAVVGLGFIWIALDADNQSWHDKIAGTIVVRVPKGTPLV
jgi:uncharacterized RDD family membrane protein YckC